MDGDKKAKNLLETFQNPANIKAWRPLEAPLARLLALVGAARVPAGCISRSSWESGLSWGPFRGVLGHLGLFRGVFWSDLGHFGVSGKRLGMDFLSKRKKTEAFHLEWHGAFKFGSISH